MLDRHSREALRPPFVLLGLFALVTLIGVVTVLVPSLDDDTDEIAGRVAESIQDSLGVETTQRGTDIQFGPEQPS